MREALIWCRQLLVMTLKELRQLGRDRPLLLFIVWIFTGNIMMAGSNEGTELNNARILVHDADHSEASRDLIYRFRPPYFRYSGEVSSSKEGLEALQRGRVVLFIDIPEHFEKNLLRQASPVGVQALVDTSRSNTGYLAASYGGSITAGFSAEWGARARHAAPDPRIPSIGNEARIWYNPELNESWFSTVSELLMMLTVTCILLPASAMVREKERGTIEQLLVCPLSPMQIVLSKAISMALVMQVCTAAALFLVMHGMFGVPLRGSIPMFFALTALFSLTNSGIGFLIATYSRSSAQAGMLVLLTVMPIIMLSGTWTPRESMPKLLQELIVLSPLRHFIDVSYGILLRGAKMDNLMADVAWMAAIGAGLFALALWRFRKQFV